MSRTFEDKPAVRGKLPLILGITAPSSGGKTFSALRLAAGIQRVVGGDVMLGDTEAGRALHYSDLFKFRHVPFDPPFGPLDYLRFFEHCVSKKAGVIIIDQMTYEHSGEGGVLDQSERFLEEKAGDDWKKREKLLMMSLIRPKRERKKLNRAIVQMAHTPIIVCYRAEQKIKPVRGGEPIHLGWTADTTSPLVYDMTVRFLLTPGCDGRPEFNPEEAAAKLAIKNPEQFRSWFKPGLQLSEEVGEKLARWAAGDGGGQAPSPPPPNGERAALEREIAALVASLKIGGGGFKERFGKTRGEMSIDELIEVVAKLTAEMERP